MPCAASRRESRYPSYSIFVKKRGEPFLYKREKDGYTQEYTMILLRLCELWILQNGKGKI